MQITQRKKWMYWLPLFILLALVCVPVFAGPVSHPAPPVIMPQASSVKEILPVPMSDPRWGIEGCPGNVAIFRFINDHHHPIADTAFHFMDTLGLDTVLHHARIDVEFGWVLLPIAVFVWFRRRHLFVTFILALAIETLLVVVTKQIFSHQPRPGALLDHVHEVLVLHSNSFPSGHTAMGCMIAGVLMYRESWSVKSLWVLFALMIAYQRMYVGVHFPMDIFAGIIIGVVAVAITFAIMKKRIDRVLDANAVEKDRTLSSTQVASSPDIMG